MRLRTKAILIGISTVIVILLVVNIIGRIIIVDGFDKIEIQTAQKSLKNAVAFINEEKNSMDFRVRDWARWDETYRYIVDDDVTYIARNLTNDTFSNLDTNLIVITDKSGNVLYARGYDYINKTSIEVPVKFKSKIALDDKLIGNISTGEIVSGILVTPEASMIVASCPVTDSLQNAPLAGCLILGRCLEKVELARMNRITGENITLYKKNAADLPADVGNALSQVNKDKPVYIQPLSQDRIAGYTFLTDLYGAQSLLMKLETDRDAAGMGQVSYIYYVVAGSLGELIALVLCILLLDKLIMRRIAGLNNHVRGIAISGDHGKRLRLTGTDEIDSLALQINNMLETLQKSYQQIIEQENKYRLVTDNITDIIIVLSMDLKITYLSPSALADRGFTNEELMSIPLDQQMPAESLNRTYVTFKEALEKETNSPGSMGVVKMDLEIYRKDRSSFWTENSFSLIRDEQGRPVSILGVGREITERKLAEKEMLLQRDLAMKLSGTSSLVEAVRTCIETAFEATGFDCGVAYVVKEDGKLNAMCLTGFSPAYLETVTSISGKPDLGKQVLPDIPVYVGKEDGAGDIDVAEMREGITAYAIMPAYEKKGIIAYLYVGSHKADNISEENRRTLESITNLMGSVIGRLKAEEELRESESKYHMLIESSTDGVAIIQDGVYKYINQTLARMFGYSREELVGMPFLSLVAPAWMDMVVERQRKRLSGQPAPEKYEVGMLYRDGSIKEMELAGSLISYEGKPATMAVVTDITEKKTWENRKLVAQKLESIGVLAGGIAHDFNNILAAILGNISLAKLSDGQNPEVEAQLTKAENACARAKDLTHQLLTFAKGGTPVKNTRSLVELLHDSANFALSGSNVKAEFEISKDLWPADIDIEQISRVIHNLVVNADQAMPNGGIIKICAENTIINEVNLLSLPGGRFVIISVIDHGEGIPVHNIKYIFDPYFTTRQKGSGLGLAMTYSVIKNHGGTISVDSTVGTGTTFRVYLPASEQNVQEANHETGTYCSLKGKRILLVDDEEMIRDVTSRILKHMGVGEVLIAGDGHEAVSVYEQSMINNSPVDAVIMDLTIPGGMGGREAVLELLKIDPGMKAIVSSGYASDPILSEYKKFGFKGVLVKPYKIQELDKVLCDVLADSGR